MLNHMWVYNDLRLFSMGVYKEEIDGQIQAAGVGCGVYLSLR